MGRVIDGKAEMVIDRSTLLAYVKRDAKEVTLETLADGVCKAFCGPRNLAKGLVGLQLDIHRRQHIEIARAIYAHI